MHLVLLAAAAWSIALGVRRAFRLTHRSASTQPHEYLADWVIALSLMGAGLWAWQSHSWLALLAGYASGWVVLYWLPASPARGRAHRTA